MTLELTFRGTLNKEYETSSQTKLGTHEMLYTMDEGSIVSCVVGHALFSDDTGNSRSNNPAQSPYIRSDIPNSLRPRLATIAWGSGQRCDVEARR